MRFSRWLPVSLATLFVLLTLGGAALAQGAQTISITSPAPGTTVGSPVVITGRTSGPPLNNTLSYQITADNGALLGQGEFGVNPIPGAGSQFTANLAFSVPAGGGPIRIDITDRDDQGGIVAFAYTVLQASPPNPSDQPGAISSEPTQIIVIDSPTLGANVGSPMTITGRTNLYPVAGELGYEVQGAGTTNLGNGTFPVSGQAGGSGTFIAAIPFAAPAEGGPIQLVVFEQNPETLAYTAITTLRLNVAPPAPSQAITIAAPVEGSQVTNPFNVLGQATAAPARGALSFSIVDTSGVPLGNGDIPVNLVGEAWVFNAPVSFTSPAPGSGLVLFVADQEANGTVRASSQVLLTFNPPPPTATPAPPPAEQGITIGSPAPGTVVGSPVVVTGVTSRRPAQGFLNYRFTDLNGAPLTTGTFGVSPLPGGGTAFNVSLTFPVPPDGRPIRLQVWDQDAAGNILATTSVDLLVSPSSQDLSINITSPPAESFVGSPVSIAGDTTIFPNGGVLFFRFTDPSNRSLGEGSFPVTGSPGQPSFFQASLNFNPPPGGGFFRLEVFGRDPSGAPVGNTFLTLQWGGSATGGDLTGRTWQLVNFGPQSNPTWIQGPPITAVFGTDGIVRGSAPCLDYDAPYSTNGASISIIRPRIFARNCDQPDWIRQQAQDYTVRLAAAETYSVNGNQLRIFYENGSSAFVYNTP